MGRIEINRMIGCQGPPKNLKGGLFFIIIYSRIGFHPPLSLSLSLFFFLSIFQSPRFATRRSSVSLSCFVTVRLWLSHCNPPPPSHRDVKSSPISARHRLSVSHRVSARLCQVCSSSLCPSLKLYSIDGVS